MPLDKMPNSDEFVLTHNSKVLHVKGNPVACIIDNQNDSRYASLPNDSSLRASLLGFLNKHDDLGLLMGFKLKIQTDSEFFEYTVYPDEEFIDAVIFDESIHIVNDSMDNLFSLRKIVTDQFVKTRSEFDKFKKMM
ncbi:MAG: hypothetical protein OPY06_04975 [Nitrosopumilus sp.]|nr:hypothetical protein [Nitrosopumilus sp.]MDF2423187.1 hypothetical protein [Nitrosopumilus sp.]MDF2426028.1 hypothetical protein [Nitrosopumilus sp.]MDF2427502.1 hypothetical protein [Nitrosopumilus sp.]MDF2427624.1 hypothetical protein [Nitrosopumilus sp.]